MPHSQARLPAGDSCSPSVRHRLTDRAYLLLHHWAIKRFQIKIEAPDWEDFEEVELPRLPELGEAINTKYGTLLVTQTDASPGTDRYDGKIVCRMP